MIYLYEHHVGFDATQIGFPSISGCQAILLQTSTGLYGYHALGGETPEQAKKRAAGFAQFVREHSINNTVQKLYGACFVAWRGYRGDDKMAGWRAEIAEYAEAVGCTDVQCFDIGKKIKGKTVGGNTVTVSAYVEFRLVNGECEIYYKKWEKMQESTAAPLTLSAQNFRKIHQTKGTLIDPDKPMKPVEIITTKSNKGELHHA